MSMPVMDGFEASRRIREIEKRREESSESSGKPKNKRTLIIALTGLASAQDRDAALKSGVDLFITKPIKFQKLKELLKSYEQGQFEQKAANEGIGDSAK